MAEPIDTEAPMTLADYEVTLKGLMRAVRTMRQAAEAVQPLAEKIRLQRALADLERARAITRRLYHDFEDAALILQRYPPKP